MSKNQTISIFLRARPSKKSYPGFDLLKDDNKCEFKIAKDPKAGYINNTLEKYQFQFNQVFPMETTQQEIFDKIAKDVIDQAIEGYNGTIFAYGQTGSGKTFTMTGGPERYQDRGIIPRSISYIFDQAKKRTDLVYKMINVSISYLEIYNNDGYDLLDENHSTKNLHDLPKVIPRENQNEEIILSGLSLHKAPTEEDALNLLFIGDTNRVVSETPKNDASTRSHCIFMISIETRQPNSDVKTVARVHLVDLSGSERIGKTGVEGKLQLEARHINCSLHFLESVIVQLNKRAQGENIHITYRNSLMTLVLRDSLGGNCKTNMIATISTEEDDIDESISTCRFAGRVALIKNQVIRNEAVDPSIIIERLKRENKQLKAEIAMLKGQSEDKDHLESYEIDECKRQVDEFLNSKDPSSVLILNDRLKINECFFYIKHLYNNEIRSDKKAIQNNNEQKQPQQQQVKMIPQASPQQEEEIKRLKLLVQQRDNEIMILLNMIEKEKQKGVNNEVVENIKQNDKEIIQSMVNVSQPVQFPNYEQEISRASQIYNEQQKTSNSKVMQGGLDGTKIMQGGLDTKPKQQQLQTSQQTTDVESMLYQPLQLTNEQLLDRNQSFEMFRKSYRKNQAMEENKEILKEKFQKGKELGQIVNQSRLKINNIKNQIEQLRKDKVVQGLHGDTSVIDKEEERLSVEIENQKSIYKQSFDQLKELKGEIERIQFLLEKNRERMQGDFEKWLDVMLQQRNLSMTGSKVKDKEVEKKLEQFYKNKEIINKI